MPVKRLPQGKLHAPDPDNLVGKRVVVGPKTNLRAFVRAARTRSRTVPPFMSVAVVVSRGTYRLEDSELWLSQRNGSRGDWSAFIGTDRDQVIAQAQETAERWSGIDEAKQYEVWVGKLDGVVVRPAPRFKVVDLTMRRVPK